MSSSHVSVRLTKEQIARVDALIPRFSTTWMEAKRSAVLRALIEYALVRFERESDQEPGIEEDRRGDVHADVGAAAEKEKAR